MTNSVDRKGELQKLIDRAYATNVANYAALRALDTFCEKHYGAAPSDIDCDWVLDSLYGACGEGYRLSDLEFDRHMREALEMKQ